MSTETFDAQRIMVLTGVHLAFVVSALLLAFIDRMSFRDH
jgi:uncharacterized membrane protein YqhA